MISSRLFSVGCFYWLVLKNTWPCRGPETGTESDAGNISGDALLFHVKLFHFSHKGGTVHFQLQTGHFKVKCFSAEVFSKSQSEKLSFRSFSYSSYNYLCSCYQYISTHWNYSKTWAWGLWHGEQQKLLCQFPLPLFCFCHCPSCEPWLLISRSCAAVFGDCSLSNLQCMNTILLMWHGGCNFLPAFKVWHFSDG